MQKEVKSQPRGRRWSPREGNYKTLAWVLGVCCVLLIILAATCALYAPARRSTDNVAEWHSNDVAGYLCRTQLNATGRTRVFNVTSQHSSKSRGNGTSRNRRYLNPVVDLTNDRYDYDYAIEDVNENLMILQRPVRVIPFPPRLDYWFHISLWRKGDDLGANGRTKLIPTEHCDRVVVKKHERRDLVPANYKHLPSVKFAQCRIPVYPVFYGYHAMPNGVVFEAMSYDGMSLQTLLERGILGPRITGHNYKIFLRITYKLIRILRHLEQLGMVHRCVEPSSVILRPVNPISFENGQTSLHADDEVILTRLHCASLPSGGDDVDPASPYASPEMLARAAGQNQAAITGRTTKFQLSHLFLQSTGSTIREVNGKQVVSINPSAAAFSWVAQPQQQAPVQGNREGLREGAASERRDSRPKAIKSPVDEERANAEQFVRTLRFAEGDTEPTFEGLRFQQIFNTLFEIPGQPAVPARPAQPAAPGRPAVRATKAKPASPPKPFGNFATNVRLAAPFRVGANGAPPLHELQALRVYNVDRMVSGQPQYAVRNFYPSLLPFGAVECNFAGDDVSNGPKLCSVSEFEGLLAERRAANGVPANRAGVYCFDPAAPVPNLPAVAYPGQWNHARCKEWLGKKPVLANTYGIVGLKIEFCTTSRGKSGHRVVRLRPRADNSGSVFHVACYAPNDCAQDANPPYLPYREKLWWSVDDVLVPYSSTDNPNYGALSPLLPACTHNPNQWVMSWRQEHRAHYVQQAVCMLKSADKTPIPVPATGPLPRTIPKQTYTMTQRVPGQRGIWILWNDRWDNVRDPDTGVRQDRCGTEPDVLEWLRACREREHYVCILKDGDHSVQEFTTTMWELVRDQMADKDSLLITHMTHGNTERGRHIVWFAKNGIAKQSLDMDEFLEALFAAPQLYGKTKYAMVGSCRGGNADVHTLRDETQRTQSSRGSSLCPEITQQSDVNTAIERFPIVVPHYAKPSSTQSSPVRTFLEYLHDTVPSRTLIVKSASDGCRGIRFDSGTNFIQKYLEVLRQWPTDTANELWHKAGGRITRENDIAYTKDGTCVLRQTPTVTKDTTGHPGYVQPPRTRRLKDDELYPAGVTPFQWSPEAAAHCQRLAQGGGGDAEPASSGGAASNGRSRSGGAVVGGQARLNKPTPNDVAFYMPPAN